MPHRSRSLASLVSPRLLLLIVSLFAAGSLPKPVQAVSAGIVISQVYGGGGNSGAVYQNDFIELFNRGTATVSLAGWSVQYTSASGTGNFGSATNLITPLAGSLAPGQYMLVQEASNAAVGGLLPSADITDTTPINMSGTGGKVALVNTTTPLGCNGGSTPCTAAALATIVDLIGWDGANFFEGSAAPATTSSTADLRGAYGCTDTDNNSSDFSAGTPNPRNTATPPALCLTVSNVSLQEGNSGTTSFDFTVSLSAPAGTGGLTFDIATADNSATAPSDYAIKSLTSQTIPQGGSSYTFSVLVNGDTTPEANETFFVNVANVTSSSNVGIINGQGTIVNDDAPNLTINDVSLNEGNSGTTSFDFTVSLSSPAGPGGVTFDIATADGTATSPSDYAAKSLTGQSIPAGSSSYTFSVSVSGDTTTEPDETFIVSVTNVAGANLGDGQGQGTIVNDDVCGLSFTPIYQIQGSGLSAAVTGTVTTMGVVVGDFEGSTSVGIQGFYMQDATGDGDPATSDGIFVYTGNTGLVSAGQLVRVTGFARERFNQTTLNGSNSDTAAVTAANIVNCGTGSVTPTDVTMPFADADFPERYEGMLVRLPQSLVISEYFNYDRFGEMVLALPLSGEPRPFTGTAIDEPGAPANARTLANSLRRITLDDGLGAQNPNTLRHPNGNAFALNNRFRGGDTVQNVVGVLGYDFNLYRIQPTGPADYVSTNPRPAAPEPVGGNLRVAAMNTLNFFLTADYPTGDPLDNKCGPAQNVECRGWDSDQTTEFTRQRDKLLQALLGLNADVLGLNELENTAGVDPLADATRGIVPGLNALFGAGTYAAIDTGVIGTDAIRVGLIYKPSKVTPVGPFKLLTSAVDPRFVDTKSRPALAQTFDVNATGARFTVVINHLKSKGSDCNDIGDPDLGDGQGNCSQTRKLAAQALVDWLATDPTGSGDPDFLIMGDLNSYAKEDSVDAIKAGPDDVANTLDDYTNLIAKYQGVYAYSYVFDGQAGYLDHALANASLAGQVNRAADWHINADEPDVLDYDTTFKPPAQDALYESNAYRTSDHDALVVGLNLLYNFSGFFQPVDNPPVFNGLKAGSAVPIKFSLGGDKGLDIFAAGYPKSVDITCSSSSTVDAVDSTAAAGSSTLAYDPTTNQYTYVWKTDKAWAGTCRQLVVKLNDGSEHRANFSFNK